MTRTVPIASDGTHGCVPHSNRAKTVLPIKAHTSIPKMQNNRIEVGRFLVSPMIRSDGEGRFVASVSIRSGRGMSSVDRVMRFTPLFDCRHDAWRYAEDEGRAWALRH